MKYGEELIEFEIPDKNLLKIASPQDVEPVKDDIAEIMRAINNPIDGKTIPELVSAKSKVVVIIDDDIRSTPTKKILPIILKELNKYGVSDENIKIIIGCGAHYSSGVSTLKDYINKKLGIEIATRYAWEVHDPYLPFFSTSRAKRSIMDTGKFTSSGTPVHILKSVMDADVKITIGCVITHAITGYSGGSKIVAAGVAGQETINHNHFDVSFAGKIDPNIVGTTENNVRSDMDEIAKIVGVDMSINVVMKEPELKIIGIRAGDIVKAHREAVKLYNSVYQIQMQVADATIISDYPLYYRMQRYGLSSAQVVTKEGGVIIVLAPYSNMIKTARPETLNYCKLPPEELRERILKRDPSLPRFSGASIAMSFCLFARKYHIILVSEGFTNEMAEEIGYEKSPNIDSAIKRIWELMGNDAKINILNHGTYICPLVNI
jgi:nickel-dependent lactate racemase